MLTPPVRAALDRLEANRTYEARFETGNVWRARFGIRGAEHEGLTQIGEYDGGNYGLFVGPGDNPDVFAIDHEDGHPRRIARLDEFLAALSPTPGPRELGAREKQLLRVLIDGGPRALDEVSKLLDEGADANTANEYGVTALHFACIGGMIRDDQRVPLVSRLLAAGADARAVLPRAVSTGMAQGEAGMSALHFIRSGMPVAHVEALRALVAAGANVDAADRIGQTPMHRATSAPPEFMQALLEAGADPNPATLEEEFEIPAGTTPLHGATVSIPHLTLLLASPRIVVDPRDAVGMTPLHRAAMKDATEAVDMLIRAGADRTIASTASITPWWAKKQHVQMPVGTTPLRAAELVGADAAAARLRIEP